MKTLNYSRAVRAAMIGIAMTGSVTGARAEIKDYEFQLFDKTVKAGPDKTFSVPLVSTAVCRACATAGQRFSN